MRVELNNIVGLNKHAVTAITFYREKLASYSCLYIVVSDRLFTCRSKEAEGLTGPSCT